MSALLANVSVAIGVLLTGVSLLLMVIALLAWRRVGAGRMGWLGVAFAGFAALGVVLSIDAYQTRGDPAVPVVPALCLAIVLSLYLAVLKR